MRPSIKVDIWTWIHISKEHHSSDAVFNTQEYYISSNCLYIYTEKGDAPFWKRFADKNVIFIRYCRPNDTILNNTQGLENGAFLNSAIWRANPTKTMAGYVVEYL